MKIFISADIEGTCGITNWEEADKTSPTYEYHRVQMTKEVDAACKGANECGCDYILVKDAHGSARNIIPNMLPDNTSILRGWAGSPLGMMDGLDESFDAVLYVGYHSGGATNGNPLAHTKSSKIIDYIKINGELADEFTINSYTAGYYNVPVAYLSGDELLCNSLKHVNENINTTVVCKGIGDATISINPNVAVNKIQQDVKEALSGELSKYKVNMPDTFKVEIRFKHHHKAFRAAFYPGASINDEHSIVFESDDYMEVLKLFLFTIC